jgi:hypothetical protein
MNENKLKQLKDDFLNKEITKQSYIDKAFEIHNVLFQYKDYLKSSDISKIES